MVGGRGRGVNLSLSLSRLLGWGDSRGRVSECVVCEGAGFVGEGGGGMRANIQEGVLVAVAGGCWGGLCGCGGVEYTICDGGMRCGRVGAERGAVMVMVVRFVIRGACVDKSELKEEMFPPPCFSPDLCTLCCAPTDRPSIINFAVGNRLPKCATKGIL